MVEYYDEIKALVPNAAVVDLNFELSKEAGKSGDSWVNGLKDAATILGKIFNKNDAAQKLNADFDKAIQAAKSAYNGTGQNHEHCGFWWRDWFFSPLFRMRFGPHIRRFRMSFGIRC